MRESQVIYKTLKALGLSNRIHHPDLEKNGNRYSIEIFKAAKDLLNALRKISFEFDKTCELQGFICQNMIYTKVNRKWLICQILNRKNVYLFVVFVFHL